MDITDHRFSVDARDAGLPNGWYELRHFPHVAYALDRALRFRCANAAWDQFAVANGAGDDQLSTRIVGRPFLDGLVEPERSHWQGILAELLTGQRPHHYEEIPCDGPGITRRIALTATPTRDEEGQVDGVLFVNYDVTAVRQKETDAARLGGALLATRTAVHHVNNHLALTVGYAELLAKSPELPAHLRETADEALQGAERAVAILNRLHRLLRASLDDHGDPDGPIIAVEGADRV